MNGEVRTIAEPIFDSNALNNNNEGNGIEVEEYSLADILNEIEACANATSKTNHHETETFTKSLMIFSFPNPSQTLRVTYSTQKKLIACALQAHPWFNKGFVLHTLEKGVSFPIVHHLKLPFDENNKNVTLLEHNALGNEYYLEQGLYEELGQINLPVISKEPKKSKEFNSKDGVFLKESELNPSESIKDCAYIMLGFKSLNTTFNEVMEETWKDWTGARSIYLNLSHDFGLKQISFYKRIKPRDLNAFMYILFVICTNVTPRNRLSLLDYVQRLRLNRMIGYLTIYAPLTDPLVELK